ncbi:MAG: cache domain-containing protein [Cellulosilyticaceae bacterium]
MNLPRLSPSTTRTLIYVSLTVLPSVLTGVVSQNVNSGLLTNNTQKALSAIGSTIYSNISVSTSSLVYSLQVLANSSEFELLDPTGISTSIGLFNRYNPNVCSNIFVVDKDLNTVYGINNNSYDGITSTSHITSAFSGQWGYYYNKDSTNTASVQFAFPILDHQSHSQAHAVLVATLDPSFFPRILAPLAEIDISITGYLIDSSGLVFATSRTKSTDNSKLRLDVDTIKSAITYSDSNTFVDYTGDTVYGSIYSLPSLEASLLLTQSASDVSTDLLDYIGYILGLLGAGTVTTSEILRKKASTSIPDTCIPPNVPTL